MYCNTGIKYIKELLFCFAGYAELITTAFIYPIFFVDSCHKFTHNVDLHSVTLGIKEAVDGKC